MKANRASLDPTLTDRPKTEDGTILGTLSYMSPEQTEGKKLDPRSDIFSLGAMLYEMLTGRAAFTGSSKASIMAAILREDPKLAREVVAGIPPELERIVNRAAQDPARRFQHMDDLKVELRRVEGKSRIPAICLPLCPPRRVAAALVIPAWDPGRDSGVSISGSSFAMRFGR